MLVYEKYAFEQTEIKEGGEGREKRVLRGVVGEVAEIYEWCVCVCVLLIKLKKSMLLSKQTER
jgi:hypothetical protein